MPHVSTIISGAASLGVLAGVVSGIFYLVVAGIRWAGKLRAALQDADEQRRQSGVSPGACVVCGRPPDHFPPEPLEAVGCTECGGTTWKGDGCCRPSSIGWRCVLCHVKRDLKKTSKDWMTQRSVEEETEIENDDRNVEAETTQIRDFIEKLVEAIVGGPLDGVSVGKLSNHAAYLGMFAKYHSSLCQGVARLGFALQMSIANKTGPDVDSPSSAHSALKQIVEKVVMEAMSLPNLKKVAVPTMNGTTNNHDDFADKTYEDILATAILNKVIERYQQQYRRHAENVDRNSNVVTSRTNSVGSTSVHDDDISDWSDTSKTEPLSLTIEECIEEVTTTVSDGSDDEERRDLTSSDFTIPGVKQNGRVPFPECGVDIVDAASEKEDTGDREEQSSVTEIVTPVDTWEENWLFQRKKLRTQPSAHHPVPVPMLVPNPSQDYRALIGGVDADDISDMSECSDSALEDVVLADDSSRQPLQDDTHSSQNASSELSVKNTTDLTPNQDVHTEESPVESSIPTSNPNEENTVTIHTIDHVKNSVSPEDDIDSRLKKAEENATKRLEELRNLSRSSESPSEDSKDILDERIVNDSDVFEAKSIFITSPSDSLLSEDSLPHSLSQKDREFTVDYEEVPTIGLRQQSVPVPRPRSLDLIYNESENLEKPPRCPIAEREKAKWQKPSVMPHNPYTSENIEKRLSNNKKGDYSNRSSTSSLASIEFPELHETSGKFQATPTKSTEEPETLRYKRDYYINSSRHSTGDPNFPSPSPVLSSRSESSIGESAARTPTPDYINENKEADQERNKTNYNEENFNLTLDSKDNLKDKPPIPPVVQRRLSFKRSNAMTEAVSPLPSVRQLAQRFSKTEVDLKPVFSRSAIDLSNIESTSEDTPRERESKTKIQLRAKRNEEREPEIDYSLTPVVEIISKLTKREQEPKRKVNVQEEIFKEIAQIRDESKRSSKKSSRDLVKGETSQNHSEVNEAQVESKDVFLATPVKEQSKYINQVIKQKQVPKQVHSLTARSISKEFREELKQNNSNNIRKIGRVSSVDSESSDKLPTSEEVRPVTPPIDLRSARRFWEEKVGNSQK